jgi:two-component system nitrogen regulation sensor histidine kinase NtrY
LSFSPLHNHLPSRSLLFFAAGLFVLSFISAYYFQTKPSVDLQQRKLERYIQREERDAEAVLNDSALMRKLVQRTETLDNLKGIEAKNYGLFLYAETIGGSSNLLFWSNQRILPPVDDPTVGEGTTFRQLANGYYVVIKRNLRLPGMSNRVMAFVLIPVLSQYYLQTDYLATRFVHDEDAVKKISLAEQATGYPIRSVGGKPLFHIRRLAHSNIPVSDTLTLIIRFLALVFLLVYLQLVAESIVRRSRALHGLLFLAGMLLLLRLLLYFFPGLFFLRQFELFNPLIYASNFINRSLGDLLINAGMLCWLVIFAWNSMGPGGRVPRFLKQNMIFTAGTGAVFILIFSTFQLANVVRGLVANSKISFNVTDFFSLDSYTVIGLIVLALLCLTYYYFTRLLFRIIFSAFRGRQIYIYFFIALVGLVFLTFRSGNEIVLFHLPVLLWLIIYTLLLSQETFIINRFNATITGVLFWIFIFSVSLAVVILQGNRSNELRIRKGMAEKYDRLTDPSSNSVLSIAITYLNNRFLQANFNRFRVPTESRAIRDSIIASNFTPGYSTGYDTRIFVFDSLNQGLHNDQPTSFAELNTIFTLQSKSTGIPDLYYHETSFDRLTYITKREIRDSTGFLGSFFVMSTPRQYGSTDALYPELFRSVTRNDPGYSPLYSYAIYNNRLLTSASNKYPFPISLDPSQVPVSEYEQRLKEGYNELWYKAGNRKTVVIVRKQDSLLESITLFSYLFCAFLFMVGLLQFISFLVRLLQDGKAWNLFSRLNIRTQIHGTVIFISILSFLIIGVATISFFISRYQRNNEDRLSRTASIMVKEMEKPLAASVSDTLQVTDSATRAGLERLVGEVADIHNVDVNVYDLEGNLEVTSDEDVYKRGILSNKMHPVAFYHLSRLREVQRVQEENVSTLEYLSIYTSVRDNRGNVVKYLNIPYFSSQLDLKQEISNFLVTIINLNAFIFLIAGIIALFITNKITQSFSVIGEKMRAITLGGTNEEIAWNRNDEIGELVTQYNRMVHELEKSADALAKSEREGAWREMARQVAHEIKNPLTPMKLSIQYLQRAINTNHSNVKELTASVANTLIEQIDHLSKIAADFSQFANIGNKRLELIDLHNVIGSLVDLYQTNPKVELTWRKTSGSLVLKGDKTHMNRLFTNLLANAVEACAEQPSCLITIEERRLEDRALIRITDNGEGIPEEMQSRIFTPNFTTKTSGTGLGLAMCKSIVEQAGGQIWFETKTGEGTSFFIELPIIG